MGIVLDQTEKGKYRSGIYQRQKDPIYTRLKNVPVCTRLKIQLGLVYIGIKMVDIGPVLYYSQK